MEFLAELGSAKRRINGDAGIYQAAAALAIISFDAVLSDPLKGGIGSLSINPVTLEVESIIPFDERLEALNQPEAILARKYSYMMEADPEEYTRLFPKSQEEKDYDAAALFDITHPLTPGRTPRPADF